MSMVVQSELENVLNRSMRDITSCFAGIQLYEQDSSLSNDICTVHTTFEGSYDDALILFADTAMFNRLAKKVLHTEQVTQQDVEDAATEYFNIVCGRIVAGLSRTSRIVSRFKIPQFRIGHYLPDQNAVCRCLLKYRSEAFESVQLIYLSSVCLQS